MKPHENMDADTLARLVERAMGNLAPAEAQAIDDHVASCALCREELSWLNDGVAELHFSSDAEEPPRDLLPRIRERIRRQASTQPWKEWEHAPDADSFIVRAAGEESWESTAIPGIDVRSLSVDREADRVTMLVRMAAGTSYPAHRHGGTEECFVLEGDLNVGAERMRAGDFQRMEEGSLHPDQSTDGGCLLLITSSLRDELLD